MVHWKSLYHLFTLTLFLFELMFYFQRNKDFDELSHRFTGRSDSLKCSVLVMVPTQQESEKELY